MKTLWQNFRVQPVQRRAELYLNMEHFLHALSACLRPDVGLIISSHFFSRIQGCRKLRQKKRKQIRDKGSADKLANQQRPGERDEMCGRERRRQKRVGLDANSSHLEKH